MDYSIILNYSYSNLLTLDDSDPMGLVENIIVDIMYEEYEEEENEISSLEEPISKKVGFFDLLYYNVWKSDNVGTNIFDAFDLSMNTIEMGEVLIDFETGHTKDEICNFEIINPNILIVNRVGIYPEFRSKGLGKEATKGIIKNFAGKCGYIALKSWPLQFENPNTLGSSESERTRMQLQLLETNRKKAQRQLNKFYRECGFKNLPGYSNFFIYKYL